MRLIDADALADALFDKRKNYPQWVADTIGGMPTIDIDVLLKEQEAVEPKQVGLYGKEEWYGLVCVCPDCKAEWMSDKADTHFCPKCGQAVKWR